MVKWLCPIPGGSSPDSGKIKILSKYLLPQFRVREFQQEQVSQQSGHNAVLISHWRTHPWTWVLPANLAPHWPFRVGADPHFARLEWFPTLPSSFSKVVLRKTPDKFIKASQYRDVSALYVIFPGSLHFNNEVTNESITNIEAKSLIIKFQDLTRLPIIAHNGQKSGKNQNVHQLMNE